jgi:hypothetical protein
MLALKMLATLVVASVFTLPASAETISKALIGSGRILVTGKGTPNYWYRIISPINNNRPFGNPGQASISGAFSINGGAEHPKSCTIQLEKSVTNAPTSIWRLVKGYILLADCGPEGMQGPPGTDWSRDTVSINVECTTSNMNTWTPGNSCVMACPESSYPITASQFLHVTDSLDIDGMFAIHTFTNIQMSIFNQDEANALGISPEQFAAVYRLPQQYIDDGLNVQVGLSGRCSRPEE